MRSLLIPGLLFASLVTAEISQCACEPANAASLESRECGLCREAEKQPHETEVFFLKDINPRKPTRWLALPRLHTHVGHPLHKLPKDLRARLWKSAIAKARELWGDDWGLAYNAHSVRTQCHTHIHIGKLLQGLSPGKFIDVDGPEHIPAAEDDSGVWVHPVGSKLRVHYGEGITETTLMR
jgi:diadenosine tetraphosphate (Ap4A) HIT family hydrolase